MNLSNPEIERLDIVYESKNQKNTEWMPRHWVMNRDVNKYEKSWIRQTMNPESPKGKP